MTSPFYRIFALIGLLLLCLPASAQISVDGMENPAENIYFKDTLRSARINAPYFSRARYRAERAAVRKERNYLEFGGSLQGALTSYNGPWIAVSGGDNSIAVVANLYLHHTFTKHLFSIDTKFTATIGYNRMKVEVQGATETTSSGIWFKNQDEFAVAVAPSFKMSKNWSYGAIINFRSQFANGYVSRTQQLPTDRKSAFLSPGYLDVALGITYKCPKPKFPIIVNLSPIALSATFVESKEIRLNVWDKKPGWLAYGLDSPDKTAKYEGGSSIQIDFDRTFGKTQWLRYRTTLFSFYGWITNISHANKVSKYSDYKNAIEEWTDNGSAPEQRPFLSIHPVVRWDNTIDIKATKYISTTINFQLYYNRAQNVDVQLRTLLSLGLTYTFKNK